MALTAAELVACKRHLGMNSAAPSWYPYVDSFVTVGQILATLPPETEVECKAILTKLADIETRLTDALDRRQASAVGSITLNADELRDLRGELRRWRRELANLVGVPAVGGGGIVVT